MINSSYSLTFTCGVHSITLMFYLNGIFRLLLRPNEDRNEVWSTKEEKSITFDNSFCIVQVDKSFRFVFNSQDFENIGMCWTYVPNMYAYREFTKRNTMCVFQYACIRCNNNKYRKVFPMCLEGPCWRISIFGCRWTLFHSLNMYVNERVSGCGCERVREYQSNFKVKIHTYTTHYGLTFELDTKYAMRICLWPRKKHLHLPNTYLQTQTEKETLALNHLELMVEHI